MILHQFGAYTDKFGMGPIFFVDPAGHTCLEVKGLYRPESTDKSGLSGRLGCRL